MREFRCYLAERRALHAVAPPSAQEAELPGPDVLYNRKEAAEYLLVDPRTVTRYRVDEKLRFIRTDTGQIRYRESDLADCYFWKWGKRP